MNTPEIITWLREQAKRVPEEVHKRGMIEAADRLEELSEDLKAEMHRHDRLQDFEVAEAQELARLKAESAVMAAALKKSFGCGSCKHCDVEWDQDPCDSCRQDPNFPLWKWKGDAHE